MIRALGDLPSISGSTYTTTSVALNNLDNLAANTDAYYWPTPTTDAANTGEFYARMSGARSAPSLQFQDISPMPARRLVQVFIADPNENVPLNDSLLYRGDQHLTDATDQELFFEIDINMLLKAHNLKRVTFVDKKVKERVEHLEPIKIRELKMVVVTVAQF